MIGKQQRRGCIAKSLENSASLVELRNEAIKGTSVNTERWQQVEEVFQKALELPLHARVSFLEGACADDVALRDEAISLVEAHTRAGEFIDEPAIVRDVLVLAHAAPDPNIGRKLGAYEIIERIGSGGMGDVYLASDSRLGRRVALKILPASLVRDPTQMRRFEAEARAVSTLNHPNVLTLHEVGEQDRVNYIATEFIEGETLRHLIKSKALSLGEVLDTVIQVSSALAAAHASGITHRDIKPENIMRRGDGLVKVLDFGIAKPTGPLFDKSANMDDLTTQTEVGVLLGTVAYMSPEQARGVAVDTRTDLWSLGVVFYELLSGVQPFTGPTRMDTLAAILERDPSPLFETNSNAPEHLHKLQLILERSLSKDREVRYQTAAEFLADLKQVKQSIDFSALLDGSVTVSNAKLPNRNPIKKASATGALSTALVILVCVTILWLIYRNRPSQQEVASPAAPAIETSPYANMTDEQKLAFVRRQEQRISAMMGDRPAILNDEAVLAIKSQLDYYSSRRSKTDGKLGGESLAEIYGRAVPYVPLIARSFAAEKVPVTIGIYLPMIESEYRLCFENQIGARGIFQFLPQTAQQYGVAREEMCDVNKMTPAAARYIADRMAELGEDSQSMTLVLLSYNRGQEWVRSTLRELRGSENFQRDFWTLFAHRHELDSQFRNENAAYVPRFFAAAIIGENPKAFDLEIPPLSSLVSSTKKS